MTFSLLGQTPFVSRLTTALTITGLGALSISAVVAHPMATVRHEANLQAAHSRFTASVPSQVSPHIRLKAGHTYRLSLDRMGKIVGGTNVQLVPGGHGQVPAGSDAMDDTALPVSSWIVDFPNATGGVYCAGPYANQGWEVDYNKTTGIMIVVVPKTATLGTDYYAFFTLGVTRTYSKLFGWNIDAYGVSAMFDVV